MTSSLSELSPETLTLPKEKTYFGVLLAVSILAWLAVVVTVLGLIYGALIAFFVWLVNGLLVARLKSETVRVTAEQLPRLHAAHLEACAKLDLAEVPDLYLMQSHGVLNAFATRFAGREFVVIYSSLLEALGHDTPEIRFLLGHEIGHIRRKHLLKHLLLLPGLLIPLLGKAYHRACEATCDRFGALASGDLDGAVRAMVTLAAGKDATPQVDPRAFAEQYYAERGFFVSWHELNSGYPTLAQRVRNLVGIGDPEFRKPAGRNPFAYLFAFFTLSAGSVVVLYIVSIVAIVASLALPAVNGAMKKAKEAQTRSQASAAWLDGAPKRVPAPIPAYQVTVPSAPAPAPEEAPAPAAAPKPDSGNSASDSAPAPAPAPAN